MDKVTQQQKIVNYLQENPGATVRDLFVDLEINSPTKRISELRQLGMIHTVKCRAVNLKGEKKNFKRYFLRKETINA